MKLFLIIFLLIQKLIIASNFKERLIENIQINYPFVKKVKYSNKNVDSKIFEFILLNSNQIIVYFYENNNNNIKGKYLEKLENLQVLVESFKSNQNIPPHDSFLMNKVTKSENWVSYEILNKIIIDESELIEAENIFPLKINEILTKNLIEKKKIINAKNEVTINFVSQFMNVKSNGIALNSGGMGDIIQIKDLNSKKIYKAKIISGKDVEIKIK